MADILQRQLLSRAVARGLIRQSDLLEVGRRLGDGGALADILRDLGLAPEAIEALADVSLVGKTVGRFRLTALLGCGGMGTVYRARQLGLDREVAVKVFDVRFALNETEVGRFRREADAACRLDHAHVIQPIDFGEEGPLLYLAMEYAAGGSAEARLAERGPFAERETLETVVAIASALEYAAARGLVHRDVKPGNILYTAAGVPKLADLGLVLDMASARLTQGEAAIGTVHYMAPEQALARPLDIEADVYSLGIAAFEMLAGEPPFEAPQPIAIVAQHMKAPLPDIREWRSEVSEGTARLLRWMCAKQAATRPAPGEVVEAGRELLAGGAERVEIPVPPHEPILEPPAAAPAPPSRRAARVAAIAAAAALVLLGAATAYVHGTRRERPPAVDPAAQARGIEELKALLLSRRAPDGGWGEAPGEPTDPWVSGEALEGLLLLDDPALRGPLGAVVERLDALALDGAATGDSPGFAGFPYLVGVDTVACAEATAAVGRAVALAIGRVEGDPAPLARKVFDYLLRTQTESGAWATVPPLGERGAMTSATADGLSAVAALAAALGEERRALPAVTRAAERLARDYDRAGGFFPVNPRRREGAGRRVAGLDEAAALALLDARDLARRAEGALPAAADEVLRDFAARLEPAAIEPGAVGEAAMEDYRFQRLLPERYRTSAAEFAWLPATWRFVLAHRIAADPDLPRRTEWAAEARRLRASVPRLAQVFAGVPATWKIAEALMGAAAVRAAEANGVPCGLVWLVRSPRRRPYRRRRRLRGRRCGPFGRGAPA